MSALKAYVLLVTLAAIIGLLVSVVPLVRGVLMYGSPDLVDTRPELASLDTFILNKSKPVNMSEDMLSLWLKHGKTEWSFYTPTFWDRDHWQVAYEAEKNQHAQAVRSKAKCDVITYGALCAFCVLLLIIHLRWVRRLVADRSA
jgi:hypothetical protein